LIGVDQHGGLNAELLTGEHLFGHRVEREAEDFHA
jgi:hypothetical protein